MLLLVLFIIRIRNIQHEALFQIEYVISMANQLIQYRLFYRVTFPEFIISFIQQLNHLLMISIDLLYTNQKTNIPFNYRHT